MSKKVTHISVNKLESTMKENVTVVPMDGYPDIEITIRRVLPLREVLQFVEDVVSSCIDADTGRYIPEIQAFVVRSSVLTRYANFTMPKDPEKQYDMIYNTNALQQVMSYIDMSQYEEIMYAINERVKHELAMMESSASSQAAALTAKINSFVSSMEELFGAMDAGDMSALVKNLSDISSIDEGKLVNAVMEAKKKDANTGDKDPVVSTSGNVVTLRKKKD